MNTPSCIARLILRGVTLCSFTFVITLFATDTHAQEFSPLSPAPGIVHQDERAAQETDIAILAHEAGLSVEHVKRAIAFQQAFAAYVDELITRFPNQISAVWTEPVPHTRGHVQFTGDVPPEVTAEIEFLGLLEPNNVVLTGGGIISMADHARRAALAAEALVDLGYQHAITFFDPTNKVIRVELQLPEEAAQPSELDLVSAIQSRLRTDLDQSGAARLQSRAAIVDVRDLELTVIIGSGPMVTPEHSRGGNWLLDDGVRNCTSGWSVSGPHGDGIITAGHCGGLNQFEEPGVEPYDMTFRAERWDTGGDVEYHTTTHIEFAEFYADATSIRAVTGIRATDTMVGQSVCLYGRASDIRTCDHTVQAVGLILVSDWVLVGNLARTSSTSSIPGDSGGGWSIGNTAWGIHHGSDFFGRGYFTPVQEAQTALGVTIKTQ